MPKVYKYSLGFPGRWSYTLSAWIPAGGQVLSVGMQGHELMLWALVDPLQPQLERSFLVTGTGVDLPDLSGGLGLFIGTLHHAGPDDRLYVWHVFELVDAAGSSATFATASPAKEA